MALSASYSTLDLNDGLVEGREMQVSSLGVTWYTQRASQLHLQWSHADLESNDLAIQTILLVNDTNIIQFRWVYMIESDLP